MYVSFSFLFSYMKLLLLQAFHVVSYISTPHFNFVQNLGFFSIIASHKGIHKYK